MLKAKNARAQLWKGETTSTTWRATVLMVSMWMKTILRPTEVKTKMDSNSESEPTTKKQSNYLPDELFKAVFSQVTKTRSPQSKSNHPTRSQREHKMWKSTSSTLKVGLSHSYSSSK